MTPRVPGHPMWIFFNNIVVPEEHLLRFLLGKTEPIFRMGRDEPILTLPGVEIFVYHKYTQDSPVLFSHIRIPEG